MELGPALERTWDMADLDEIDTALANLANGVQWLADDRFVMFYLDLFRIGSIVTPNSVVICDSLLLRLLVGDAPEVLDTDAAANPQLAAAQRESARRTRAIALKQYRALFAAAREAEQSPALLIIVPLHYADHWSLLVYDAHPGTRRWLHYDSLPRSVHRMYAARFLTMLAEQNLIDGLPLEDAFIGMLSMSEQISTQPSGWECGYFTLMYAYRLLMEEEYRPGRRFQPLTAFLDGPRCTIEHWRSVMYNAFVRLAVAYRIEYMKMAVQKSMAIAAPRHAKW